jgi:hypothetical protein
VKVREATVGGIGFQDLSAGVRVSFGGWEILGRLRGIGEIFAMKLVDAEIGHIDWAAYRCPCGRDGEHVATLLRTLLASGTRFNRTALEGHVMVSSSFVQELAVPTVGVLLAALADDIAVPTRVAVLENLLSFIAADGQSFSAAQAGRDIMEECASATRQGSWLLYAEIFAGRSIDAAAYAFETLSLIEDDTPRLRSVRAAAAHLLPRYLGDPAC